MSCDVCSLILLGCSHVGKTSLIYCIIGRQFEEEKEETIGVDIKNLKLDSEKGSEFVFIISDFPGHKKNADIVPDQFYENADVIFFVYDATRRDTFDEIDDWNEKIMKYVVYCLCDKEVLEVEEDDIFLGEFEHYTEENWKTVGECRVKVLYDDEVYEAVVLQVLPNNEDASELIAKVRDLIKRKKIPLSKILQLVERTKGRRNRIPPVNVFSTQSESDSENVPPISCSQKRKRLLLGDNSDEEEPPTIPTTVPFKKHCDSENVPPISSQTRKRLLSDDDNSDEEEPAPVPTTVPFEKHCSITFRTANSTACRDSRSSMMSPANSTASARPIAPFQNGRIMKTLRNVRASCEANGIDPDSIEGLQFTMCALLNKVADLEAQLIERKTNRQLIHLPVPVFQVLQDLDSIPENLKVWMLQEGGKDAKDMVYRIMNKLLSSNLQVTLTRTGASRKQKFPDEIFEVLKDAVLSQYADTTIKDIEFHVSRFFKNACDKIKLRNKK